MKKILYMVPFFFMSSMSFSVNDDVIPATHNNLNVESIEKVNEAYYNRTIDEFYIAHLNNGNFLSCRRYKCNKMETYSHQIICLEIHKKTKIHKTIDNTTFQALKDLYTRSAT